MDDQIDMLLKVSDFYVKESKRLLRKSERAKTPKEKEKHLLELNSLKNKISFEIAQINKILEDNQ